MTQQIINLGSGPDTQTGDTLYSAFTKINENFTEVYTVFGPNGTSELEGNTVTANNIVVVANVTTGNIIGYGNINVTGNIISSSYLYPNGVSILTNISGPQGPQGPTGPSTAINASDNSSNTALYPVMVGAAGSNQTPNVATTKYLFNASTGNLTVTGNAIVLTGNIVGNTAGFAIGFRDIPQVVLSANATVQPSNAGKHFYGTASSDLTLTIANNATQTFNIGATFNVINQGTGNISMLRDAGVSLYLAGNASSADRTVTSFGYATVTKVATDTWFIVGTGIS